VETSQALREAPLASSFTIAASVGLDHPLDAMAADPPERDYPYRPRWTAIVFVGAFFALCALVLGARASDNRRGVIINGIIELGPEGATNFYYTLCAGSVGFVIASIFMVYHRLAFQQRLVFGSAAMTVPVSRWSRATKQIAYRDIQGVSITAVSGQTFLYVHHVGGKYAIVASMLPSQEAFEEVRALLAGKIV
jgi:hypothetical protein